MKRIKAKIASLKQKLKIESLLDRRFLSMLLLALIGLSVVWNGLRVVQQNYTLLRKIAILEDENNILALENQNKQIQIEYYKTPEYAELKARKSNGKAASGEKVYIVTTAAALKNLKTPTVTEQEQKPKTDKPKYQQNFEAWINFFFGN